MAVGLVPPEQVALLNSHLHLQQEVNEMAKKIGHFAVIHDSTILSDTYKKLSQSGKLLFIYMAVKRAHAEKPFKYSYNEIRYDSGMTYNTISKGIKEMVSLNMLSVTHGGLEQNGNVYEIEGSWFESR